MLAAATSALELLTRFEKEPVLRRSVSCPSIWQQQKSCNPELQRRTLFDRVLQKLPGWGAHLLAAARRVLRFVYACARQRLLGTDRACARQLTLRQVRTHLYQ